MSKYLAAMIAVAFLVSMIIVCSISVVADEPQATTETHGSTPMPTATEQNSANWSWLPLILLIPLVGIVMYYFAFVREK